MHLIKQLRLIERVDQLTRLKATGTPNKLASRLEISKTTLYRLITAMRDMDAPICYDDKLQSFVYEEKVAFTFGFHSESKLISYLGIQGRTFSQN
ncbi:hypothetical protein ATE84_2903 [Aquimarina sp. MAR_2010_214]|uniref:hypothetical protein n=1 Tax=Aquimarina sp. MAR_2010_214 TaxID=1250026 RepID=UPI000C700209|nr:hypothetical protein [Aquimarina sp. MAR_2010_214]PKV50836.1 hypothetical protein ATE84_2903 [Aquimarina sp. MAR_2010_214]